MKMIDAPQSRSLQLPARILANTMLYVRPSFGFVTITYVSTEVGCVPEASEQGRHFCKVSFCVFVLCACKCARLGALDLNSLLKVNFIWS